MSGRGFGYPNNILFYLNNKLVCFVLRQPNDIYSAFDHIYIKLS